MFIVPMGSLAEPHQYSPVPALNHFYYSSTEQNNDHLKPQQCS